MVVGCGWDGISSLYLPSVPLAKSQAGEQPGALFHRHEEILHRLAVRSIGLSFKAYRSGDLQFELGGSSGRIHPNT